MTSYGRLGEAGLALVLGQVQWDDAGPWIPEAAGGDKPEEYTEGMHSGIGGPRARTGRDQAHPRLDRQRSGAGRRDRLEPDPYDDPILRPSITFFDGLVSVDRRPSPLSVNPACGPALDRITELYHVTTGWHEDLLWDPPQAPPRTLSRERRNARHRLPY